MPFKRDIFRVFPSSNNLIAFTSFVCHQLFNIHRSCNFDRVSLFYQFSQKFWSHWSNVVTNFFIITMLWWYNNSLSALCTLTHMFVTSNFISRSKTSGNKIYNDLSQKYLNLLWKLEFAFWYLAHDRLYY